MLIGFETKVLVIIVNKIVHALASIPLSDRASDVGLFCLGTSLFIHLLLLVYHVPLLCLTIMLPLFVRVLLRLVLSDRLLLHHCIGNYY